MPEYRYDPAEIEPRWQAVWANERTWEVSNREATSRRRSYVLEMLPYPSGEPHIGHLKVYSVGDAIAHFRRRRGAEVLHPPRVWPEYHPNYYGAFLRDPDGNNVEAVSHGPE